ncbi:MAG: hypothetical protein JWN93_32 [Hyphomicrobiales bacterium]|nr:hypothetical protein [Hyphomicrobiales bacterium]
MLQTAPADPLVSAAPDGDPRPYGFAGLLASLVAVAAAGAACFAGFGALAFAAAFLISGYDGAMHLAGLFGRLDPRGLGRADPEIQRAFFGVACLIYLSGVAGLVTVARWRGGRRFAPLLGWTGAFPKLRWAHWPWLLAIPAYHAFAGAVLRLFYPEYAVWMFMPRDPAALFLSLLLIAVLAPLAEELLFRGWIFTALRARLAARTAVAACTLLFALAHWDASGLYPLAVLLPGYVLTSMRERTGSVKPCVLGHGLYNFAGWALLLLVGLAIGE